MTKFLNNVDLNGNEAQNLVAHNAGTAPSTSAKAGGIYLDTNGGANKLKYHNGTTWVELSVGGSGTWQPYDADLAAIAALTADGLLRKSSGTWAMDSASYAVTTSGLNQFASTTSSQLAGVISDETGSGALVFATSPTFVTGIGTSSTTFNLVNTTATTVNFAGAATAINIGASNSTTTIAGDLVVNGVTTTVNSTTVTVDDKNLELGSVASPSDAGADGGGITLKGTTDKTWNWVSATNSWTSNVNIDIAGSGVLKIGGTQVLSASQYTGNAATATTATNVTGGAAGSLVYQSGASTTTTLGIGTSGYVLTSSGSAPQWSKKKHSETLSTSSTQYAITHGLGTADLSVTVYEVSTGEVVYTNVTNTNTTTTLDFAVAPSANQYRVVIFA